MTTYYESIRKSKMTGKKKVPNANTTTILLVLVALVAILAAFTVPVDSTVDIYIDYNIGKPLTENIKLNSLNAVAHSHTIMTSPISGASIIPGLDYLTGAAEAVALSGEVTIVAKAGDVESRKVVGKILKGTDMSGTLLLIKVPKDQKEVLVGIYESGTLIETQKVVMP